MRAKTLAPAHALTRAGHSDAVGFRVPWFTSLATEEFKEKTNGDLASVPSGGATTDFTADCAIGSLLLLVQERCRVQAQCGRALGGEPAGEAVCLVTKKVHTHVKLLL